MTVSRQLIWDLLRSFTNHVIGYFLPPLDGIGQRDVHRMRLFLVSHCVGPFLGLTVPLALYAFDPTPRWDIAALAGGILLFWTFPPLMKLGVPYRTLVIYSVANLNACIFWSCYHYGGSMSPTLVWLLVIPLLGLFYVGAERKLAADVVKIIMLCTAFFLSTLMLVPPAPNDISTESVQWLGLISIVAASSYVSVMALYYAGIYASGVSLENEAVRRLAATRETIARTEKAGAARAAFLASMSHELRTPLNAVIGYSSMLLEEAEDEGDADAADDLDRIHGAGQYLLRLVNGILDLARLEAGKVELNPERVDVARLVYDAVQARQEDARAKAIELRLDLARPQDPVVLDKLQFRTVLDTLLDNAIHQASASHVDISLSVTDERIGVSVTDNGRGITAADAKRIFDGFSLESEATGGRYGGAGLSLAVAQRICALMGGAIHLRSAPGEGAEFTIDMPASRAVGSGERPEGGAAALPVRAQTLDDSIAA